MRSAGSAWGALALLSLAMSTTSLAQGQVEATDSRGTRIRLGAPATRIVSLAPGITELLFEIGAGQKLVGTDQASDFPPAAKAIPRVGNSMAINLEQIAALHPDLVLAWPHGAAQRQSAGLRSLGVPVFVSDPDSIDAIADTFRALGRLTGTQSVADERAQALQSRARKIMLDHSGKEAIAAYIQIWDRPLMTINGRHLISNALELCGVRNVLASDPRLTPTAGREAVAALDPQVIVLLASPTQAAAWARDWTILPQMRAARTGALVEVDPDRIARPTSRLLDGVASACDALVRFRTPRPRP